jgi:hypothetical protein
MRISAPSFLHHQSLLYMGGQPTDWYRLGLLTYEQVQAWIVNLRTGTGLDCVKKLGDEYLMLAWARSL